MSHIARIKTQIGEVNEDVLDEALDLICKAEEGTELTTAVTSDYGATVSSDRAIKTKALPRGIGMSYKNKQTLEFIGDSYRVSTEFDELRKLIVQTYQTIACRKAFQRLGYKVQVPERVGPSKLRLVAQRA